MKTKIFTRLRPATCLLALLLAAGVARANYTLVGVNVGTTIDNVGTYSSSSWGTVSDAGAPAPGSGMSVSLNLTSADPLFSFSDVYANLVHIDSGNNVTSSLFLNGSQYPAVLGAGTFTQVVPLSLAGMLGNGLNGDWGLYVENLSSGGSFTVNNWSVNINTVAAPEPDQVAAMGLLGLLALTGLGYQFRKQLMGFKQGTRHTFRQRNRF